MEEMMWLRMLGGGFGSSGIDIAAVIAFVAFAVIYLLVPVLGYQAERRGGMLAALYLLVAYVGLSLVQLLAQLAPLFGRPNRGFGGGGGHDDLGLLAAFVFAFLKMVVFLVAMAAFVTGLRSTRLRPPPPDAYDDEPDIKTRSHS
jgi:hypothetical protein